MHRAPLRSPHTSAHLVKGLFKKDSVKGFHNSSFHGFYNGSCAGSVWNLGLEFG